MAANSLLSNYLCASHDTHSETDVLEKGDLAPPFAQKLRTSAVSTLIFSHSPFVFSRDAVDLRPRSPVSIQAYYAHHHVASLSPQTGISPLWQRCPTFQPKLAHCSASGTRKPISIACASVCCYRPQRHTLQLLVFNERQINN
jgi:hypothetical protein